MDIGHFAQRHDKVLLFVVAVLAVLGIYAYTTTPQSIFPTMSFSKVDVVADAGQLPPEQVRIAVAQPLERSLQTLPNVLQVTATSAQGSAEVVVTFDPKTDPQADLNWVNQALAQTRAQLPPGVDPQANIVNPNQEPVLSYAITSSTLSSALLREMAERTFIPAFAGVSGLARVAVAGGRIREFQVHLDAATLATDGVSPTQVANALSTANEVRAVGLATHFYQRYVLIVDSSLRDAAAIGQVAVPLANGSSVPISSLGEVRLGVAPATNAAAFGGTPAVILNAYGLPGADAVKMATAFQGRMSGLERHLPQGTAVHKYWDQTVLVTESQKALRDAILLGAFLAIIVILVFLRNLRMTLVAAAVIPLAMAITVFVMSRAGQTLNLMSVGGLAVAVGLIIDDAIVVIENIARNLRERPSLGVSSVVRLSMSQIGGAMAASTATTVVVFLPLALLSGIPGFFFRALAFTLASALVVSLGLALFLAPTLATRFLRVAGTHREEHGFIARVLDRYEPLLRWSLGHRKAVFLGAGAVLLVTAALLALLPSDFLPKLDEGQFEIQYAMPVGTTLQATDSAARSMEQVIVRNPSVVAEGRLTGIDSNGFSPMPPNRGLIRVGLKPVGRRPSYTLISDDLRAQLTAAVPAAQLNFHQILEDMINDLSGTPAPIELTISGVDQKVLVSLANHLAGKLAGVPGIVDPFSGVTYDDPVLRIAPAGSRLAALGINASDVANALSARSQGTVATSVPGATTLVPVRIQVGDQTGGYDSLSSNPVTGSQGTSTLGAVARVKRESLSSDITEINGQRVVRVTASISGANLSAVISRINALLRTSALPPGYHVAVGGQYKAQQASFREFLSVIFIAVVLVFTVMLGTFNSFRVPAVILTAIPLALIGVALSLFLTHTPLNVSSFMGLLLLVGIVVKNGILLVDVASKRRHAGDDITQALVVAGRTRLRPIVMTTLAAIAGLIPLAIGLGSGAEMERPLAIAVIGGLSTATIFTLILIPVLYAGFVGSVETRREEAA
ncbi:MAG: efflux RND transporter permease subunit [Candidatus Eremiobacteraeota bacterium]|nr:efflux RND transporter permease subunit [Candidatus Eremiobacteraeota bacterium]